MAKPAIPGLSVNEETCADLWHSTLSIRQETCPSCGGTAKSKGDILGIAVVAEVAMDVVEAVADAMDDSEDDA